MEAEGAGIDIISWCCYLHTATKPLIQSDLVFHTPYYELDGSMMSHSLAGYMFVRCVLEVLEKDSRSLLLVGSIP